MTPEGKLEWCKSAHHGSSSSYPICACRQIFYISADLYWLVRITQHISFSESINYPWWVSYIALTAGNFLENIWKAESQISLDKLYYMKL